MGTIKRWAVWFAGDGKLGRYLLSGALISLLDLALFSVFSVTFGWHLLPANVLSTIMSVCLSYLINRRFVFQAERNSWRTFLAFSSVTLVNGLLTQSAVIWGLAVVAGELLPFLDSAVVLPAAKVVAMGVGAVANYLGYRLTFRTGAQ